MRKNSYGEVVRSGRISETDYEIAEVRDALGRVGYHVSLTHKDAHKFLDAGFKNLGRHGFGVNGTPVQFFFKWARHWVSLQKMVRGKACSEEPPTN